MKASFCLVSFSSHVHSSFCLNVHAAALEMYKKCICYVSEVKKGGRKRKAKATEPKQPKKPAAKKEKATKSKGKQEKITDTFKVKRKVDRFNGVSEAELLTKTLPDILTFDLDIVIVSNSQLHNEVEVVCAVFYSPAAMVVIYVPSLFICITYTLQDLAVKFLNCILCVQLLCIFC